MTHLTIRNRSFVLAHASFLRAGTALYWFLNAASPFFYTPSPLSIGEAEFIYQRTGAT